MQNDLLRAVEEVSFDEAAKDLNVSSATIRNWVKAGHLESPSRGKVYQGSIDSFLKLGGAGKLTKRANKSLADDHDHAALATSISDRLSEVRNELECSIISEEYETGLSNSYRNKEGIYYTPDAIADEFFRGIDQDCSELTFFDPCCGSGNFLVAALKAGFKAENIFGYDTDPTALEIAKKRLRLLTGRDNVNIHERDFLFSGRSAHEPKMFDVIITNPPWGKKLHKDQKTAIADELGAGRSRDTSALFLFACKLLINKGGYLGLLLPDAFLNIRTFQAARIALLQTKIVRMYDFGKPFKGLMARATGFLAQISEAPEDHSISCSVNGTLHPREQSSFKNNPASIFNIGANKEEQAVLERLLSVPHVSLEGRAKWALGVVTGNNKKFCKDALADGLVPVFKGAQIRRDGIAAPELFIPEDLSMYQQVAPVEMFQANPKIVYRFISSDLVFFCDTEKRLFLNSANMIVLNPDFPVEAKVLTAYLNSRVINWFFKRVFRTHKILRSDLERIPIYNELLSAVPEFSESKLQHFLGVEEVDGTFRVKE